MNFFKILGIVLCLNLWGFSSSHAQIDRDRIGEVHVVVDAYGKKRHRFLIGDDMVFKLKGDRTRYRREIIALGDSLIHFREMRVPVALSKIECVYTPRKGAQIMKTGFTTMGLGFLAAAAVHPLVKNAQYDATESAIIGGSFIALAQFARLFIMKKHRFKNQKSRIRVMDLSKQSLSPQ